MISIVARTLNAPTPDKAAVDKALSIYTDKNKIPEWAKTGIAQATIAKIVIGPNPKLIEATKISSRGDTAALLYRLNQYVTHQTIQDTTDQALAAADTPPAPPPAGAAPPAGYGQPGYAQPAYGTPGYGYPPQQFQGRVTQQTAASPPPVYTQPPPQYPPPPQYQPQYPPPPAYQTGAYVQPNPGYRRCKEATRSRHHIRHQVRRCKAEWPPLRQAQNFRRL